MKVCLLFTFICCLAVQSLPAQAQQKDSTQAHYITVSLEIAQLQRKRDVQIYLPADYYKSSKKYPVIYMQDA